MSQLPTTVICVTPQKMCFLIWFSQIASSDLPGIQGCWPSNLQPYCVLSSYPVNLQFVTVVTHNILGIPWRRKINDAKKVPGPVLKKCVGRLAAAAHGASRERFDALRTTKRKRSELSKSALLWVNIPSRQPKRQNSELQFESRNRTERSYLFNQVITEVSYCCASETKPLYNTVPH